MDPVSLLLASTVSFAFSFIRAAARAAVPLVAGVVAAVIAGVTFALLLGSQPIGDFFSAASAVGIGVLVALVVNGSLGHVSDPLAQEARAGTIALTTTGTLAALVGQLTTGSAVLRGVFFAATWGGITAGVLGLVYFVRTESDDKADPAAKLELSEFRRTPRTSTTTAPSDDLPG